MIYETVDFVEEPLSSTSNIQRTHLLVITYFYVLLLRSYTLYVYW